LLASLASITTASPDSPWILFLQPGTYELGARSLMMKPYVEVRGAGQALTTVRSAAHEQATVVGAANTSLSLLTVEHSGGGAAQALAVDIPSSRFRLHDVTAHGRDGSLRSTGIRHSGSEEHGLIERVKAMGSSVSEQVTTRGLECNGCRMEAVDSELAASGGSVAEGVVVSQGSARLTRVEARASVGVGIAFGVRLTDSGATLHHSTVSASSFGGSWGLSTRSVSNDLQEVDIQGSILEAGINTLRRGRTYTIRIQGSQLRGGSITVEDGAVGSLLCQGVISDNPQYEGRDPCS
jgi:hypothetical protein